MQLKWGILSASNICGDFVLSMKSLNPNHHKIIAIGATNLERAQKFAEKFEIPKAYGNYDELAKDPEIDVIYIGTKSILHFAAAKLMIENGKHVLVEKPMTTDVETTKELFELGKKKNLFVMEGLFARFLPSYAMLRDAIKNQIGELVHIQSNFVMSNTSDAILFKKFGGGVCFAIAVYGLNAIFEAIDYKSRPKINAIGRSLSKNENDSGDATVSALFDFPNSELTATMLLTLRGPSKTNLVDLNYTSYIGTKGVIRLNKLNNPSEIEINGKVIKTSTDDGQTGYWLDNSHGLRFQADEVRKCIMEKKITSDLHGAEQSILLAEIIQQIMNDCDFKVEEVPKNFNFTYF